MKDLILKWNNKPDLKSEMYLAKTNTPLGNMWMGATKEGICFVDFIADHELENKTAWLPKLFRMKFIYDESHPYLKQLNMELEAYFKRELTSFNVPLVSHSTDFQKKVYQILLQVPYGSTITYKQQAAKMGNPKAIRAVAAANGKNKHLILIPCHRIIGSDNSLTGYAGGIWRKKALLELES